MAARALDLVRREYILVLIAGGYVLFRVAGFAEAEPETFIDTSSYERTADQPLTSQDFLAGARAPTLPLLYGMVTGDEARIWMQLGISIACWLALAGVVAAAIRDRVLRPLAFGAVLLFALAPEIVLWDAALLSESVSLSLTAALVAAWIRALGHPSAWAYGLVLAVSAAWALVRDPHAYVAAGIGLALAVSILLVRVGGGPRRMCAVASAGLVLIAAIGVWSGTSHFARWAYPLQNVFSLRIADEPGQLAHFQDAGMPVSPELLEAMRVHRETGQIVLEHPPGYDTPAALEQATPFHRWLLTEGRGAYTRFLLTHPAVVAEGFGYLGETLLDPELIHFTPDSSAWDAEPSAAVYPRRKVPLLVLLLGAVTAALCVGLRNGPRREWWAPAFLIASSVPFAILVHHAGALEPDRHGLVPSVFLRLGALLLLLFAIDHRLRARAEGHAPGPLRPAEGSRGRESRRAHGEARASS